MKEITMKKNTGQRYDEKASLQPGWVNIKVPEEIAESLGEIIRNYDVYLPVLEMILRKDVFFALKDFLDDPPSAKKYLQEILFQFLDMDTFTSNGYYDQHTHVLFHNIYCVLSTATEYLENQKMKGGDNV